MLKIDKNTIRCEFLLAMARELYWCSRLCKHGVRASVWYGFLHNLVLLSPFSLHVALHNHPCALSEYPKPTIEAEKERDRGIWCLRIEKVTCKECLVACWWDFCSEACVRRALIACMCAMVALISDACNCVCAWNGCAYCRQLFGSSKCYSSALKPYSHIFRTLSLTHACTAQRCATAAAAAAPKKNQTGMQCTPFNVEQREKEKENWNDTQPTKNYDYTICFYEMVGRTRLGVAIIIVAVVVVFVSSNGAYVCVRVFVAVVCLVTIIVIINVYILNCERRRRPTTTTASRVLSLSQCVAIFSTKIQTIIQFCMLSSCVYVWFYFVGGCLMIIIIKKRA